MQFQRPKSAPDWVGCVPEFFYAEPEIVFTHSYWPSHFHNCGAYFTSSQEETFQIAPDQPEGTGDVRGIPLHQEFDEAGE